MKSRIFQHESKAMDEYEDVSAVVAGSEQAPAEALKCWPMIQTKVSARR